MGRIIRIGTRESQLAIWQSTQVKQLLAGNGFDSELVTIKSEGDIDLVTPLYEIGVQGIFTRSLDAALLNDRIDIAVHSMKDVPVQLAEGIQQAAVLKRGSYKDIFVPHPDLNNQQRVSIVSRISERPGQPQEVVIATSSIRRIAQWLNRYPVDKTENLRGNVNSRLCKLKESAWHGAIFAAAGLERLGLRPENSIELDWMLPAPAQGAIMVVCRDDDQFSLDACKNFDDTDTALCTKIERDFLKGLLGGCSTPISALAQIKKDKVHFNGNMLSPDGKEKTETSFLVDRAQAAELGKTAAEKILDEGGKAVAEKIRHAK
ncbi:MAG: hydroxymethylbilane synthase [Bacteroidetes bacterium]|nr:MAG: hydroxymethylbilane synthase [Bacteroidota bacterium]